MKPESSMLLTTRMATAAILVVFSLTSLLEAQQAQTWIDAKPTKADGLYSVGEEIAWDVSVAGPGAKDATKVVFTIKRDGLTEIQKGELALQDGKARLATKLDRPGTVLVELQLPGWSAKMRKLVAAAVDIDEIKPSKPVPTDFTEFWDDKLMSLEQIPMNVKLESVDSGDEKVDYFKIQMDNINDSKIYGQLAKPKKEGKLPALLIVQWAGVYGLEKSTVTSRAANGYLALNIMAHDLPFDKPKEFYEEVGRTTLANYFQIGAEDRETSYFLRMYLACHRAAEYLSTRDDWDGKTLVVIGNSQGGQQAIVTAGLHSKVTAMAALVPAGCDATAPEIGRAAGYPYWFKTAEYKQNPKVVEVARYFDAMNFASRVKCSSLIGIGLIDESCPPSGIFAACSQISSSVEVFVLTNATHQGEGGTHNAFQNRREAMLSALVKGNEFPLKPLQIDHAESSIKGFSSGTASSSADGKLKPTNLAASWEFQLNGEGKGSIQEDGDAITFTTLDPGSERWHVQAFQTELDFEEGATYVLSFEIKSPTSRSVDVMAGINEADWHSIGLSKTIATSPEFQNQEFTFKATNVVKGNNRVGFVLGTSKGAASVRNMKIEKK